MFSGFHQISPRRLPVALALACALSAALTPSAAPAAQLGELQHIVVTLDKAKLVRMPEHVDTIVVGSPIIADVTLLKKNGLIVVTGKGYGETNVIFLDNAGQALSEAVVSVEPAAGLLVVQRGQDRESYACMPRCEPSLALGDATKFMQEASGQITARNGLAGPASH